MNEIKRRISHKLHSNAGESIGETLIALLISALALVMLAGAISATAKMIAKSDKQMGKYYDQDKTLVELNGGTGTLNINITGSDSDNIINEPHANVPYGKNDAFTNKPVVAYKKVL